MLPGGSAIVSASHAGGKFGQNAHTPVEMEPEGESLRVLGNEVRAVGRRTDTAMWRLTDDAQALTCTDWTSVMAVHDTDGATDQETSDARCASTLQNRRRHDG
jgi:hypothetical protein